MRVSWLIIAICLAFAQAGVAASDDPAVVADAQQTMANIQVSKKWIGAAGDERNVEIRLFCEQRDKFESRYINTDLSGSWQVEDVPASGMFCNVREVLQETFLSDARDCLDLLVRPGHLIECTMVNTKIVKRIDMLNRYGRIMMIAVMLGVGLAAVKKFSPI